MLAIALALALALYKDGWGSDANPKLHSDNIPETAGANTPEIPP